MKNILGQLLFIGIEGKELSQEEISFITENNIGGICLFSRNVESPEQIHKLCSQIQSLRNKMADKAPLFIGIDMEGGRVHRLKPPFTKWPALKNIGDIDSTSLAFKFAMAMGQELRAVGINLDFAPCVDVHTNPNNPIIGDRSISEDPEIVAAQSSALVRGYIKSGIIPCAKHFPGHGNTMVDSHLDLPVEETDMETLRERELVPFKKAFRARLDMVMTAHIKFKNIDPEWPVTLSKKFIKELLREELRYKNFVITDDLDMKALASYYKTEEIPVLALQAGCDILLYCNEPNSPKVAMQALQKAVADKQLDLGYLETIHKRILDFKKEVLAQPMPPDFAEASRIIGHPDHLKMAAAIAAGQNPE